MLIRASGLIYPGFYLITFGNSAHYLLEMDHGCALFDPGLSVHVQPLLQRLAQFQFSAREIREIFLTHLHPERIGAIAQLRKLNPELKVLGSAAMKSALADPALKREIYDEDCRLSAQYPEAAPFDPLPFEEYSRLLTIDKSFPESEVFPMSSDTAVRAVFSSGHMRDSAFYLCMPFNALITDEGLGYFRGKNMAAPGGDADLEEALSSAQKFKDVEISALCFPFAGLLTGQLVRKHLEALIQNTQDLFAQCDQAFRDGLSDETVRTSIKEAFYSTGSADPLLKHVLQRSFEAVWRQMLERRK